MSNNSAKQRSLRKAAEDKIGTAPAPLIEPAETLLRELQVHQIELEMQNEELRQVAIALAESRDRYVDLYDFAPVGYLTLSSAGLISEINLTGAKLLGLVRTRLVNKSFISRIIPDDRPRWARHVRSMTANGEKSTAELALRRGDGTVFHVRLDCVLQKVGADDAAIRIVMSDISARKQHELQMIESEQHFRTLANGGSALIWTSGTDKLCNYFNEPWLRFTGRSLEQELGNGWTEGVHPGDFERCRQIYVTAFDQRQSFSMDYRLRHADGSYHWIRDDGSPRYDSRDQFLGYIGFCMDITNRKRVDQALQESEARLQMFFEHAPAALAIFDRDMRYLAVSRRWMEDLSLGDRDVVGCSHYELFPEIPEVWKDVHRRALGGEILHSDEDRFERADGCIQWLRWAVRPWYTPDGNVGGITIFAEEITARKQAKVESERLLSQLEALIEAAPIGIALHDKEDRFIAINSVLAQINGLPRAVHIGRTTRELLPAPVADATQALRFSVLESGRPLINLEFRAVGRRPSARWQVH